jgi:hypothetical protein
MDWKHKLAMASAAFVSMPAATVAEVNTLCSGRRAAPPFSRRTASVLVPIDSGIRDLTAAVYVEPEVNQPACALKYELTYTLSKVELSSGSVGGSGNEDGIISDVTRTVDVEPGTGTIFRINANEIPTDASLVRVEVRVSTVDDNGRSVLFTDRNLNGCKPPSIQTSFSLRDLNGGKSFLFHKIEYQYTVITR